MECAAALARPTTIYQRKLVILVTANALLRARGEPITLDDVAY